MSNCAPKDLTTEGRPRSKAARLRAIVLVVVHLLIAVHIAHWMSAERTLSPLEPSEAMEFTKRGVINAGLVFFALLTLSTLFLGRFFCGWGCHVVALQDLCRWMLLKVGIQPRPLRSRALAVVPFLAFGYMFLLPLWTRPSTPQTSVELTTAEFWATFPPWWGALITFFVCGFVVVYLLGAKGFCTYGCPYGALFGAVDKLSPGRIRVTDACEGCGLCTANCSSNVDVKREVATFGMVVDSGCMKCLDCVSLCPKEALYFGFGKPALAKRAVARGKRLSWGREVLLSLSCLAIFVTVRGLYGVVPFLLALGLGCAGAFLAAALFDLVRSRPTSLPGVALRNDKGITRGGLLFLGAGAVALFFLAHSALVQWHGYRSAVAFRQLGHVRQHYFSLNRPPIDKDVRAAADEVIAHGGRALSMGLLSDPRRELEVGWARLMLGDQLAFQKHLVRVAGRVRDPRVPLMELANHYRLIGDRSQAIEYYGKVLECDPEHVDAANYRADVLIERAELEWQSGKVEEAEASLRLALREAPDHQRARVRLKELCVSVGEVHIADRRAEPAEEAFRKALELDPVDLGVRSAVAEVLLVRGKRDEAIALLEEGCDLAPENPAALRIVAFTHLTLGNVELASAACARAEALPDPRAETARLRATIEAAR